LRLKDKMQVNSKAIVGLGPSELSSAKTKRQRRPEVKIFAKDAEYVAGGSDFRRMVEDDIGP
jgi:hypothetical protein